MTNMYELLSNAETIGDRIRRLMESRHMTLGELHRQSGIAKGYLSDLLNEEAGGESRRKPSAETLYAIGSVLGASVADLLGKTRSTEDHGTWPPGLAEYVNQNGVAPEEARMLAGISARGKTPATANEWHLMHRMILASLEDGS